MSLYNIPRHRRHGNSSPMKKLICSRSTCSRERYSTMLIPGLHPANERRRYKVTRLSLAGRKPRISPVVFLRQHTHDFVFSLFAVVESPVLPKCVPFAHISRGQSYDCPISHVFTRRIKWPGLSAAEKTWAKSNHHKHSKTLFIFLGVLCTVFSYIIGKIQTHLGAPTVKK